MKTIELTNLDIQAIKIAIKALEYNIAAIKDEPLFLDKESQMGILLRTAKIECEQSNSILKQLLERIK